jgi:hypothetical protein
MYGHRRTLATTWKASDSQQRSDTAYDSGNDSRLQHPKGRPYFWDADTKCWRLGRASIQRKLDNEHAQFGIARISIGFA